MAILDQHVVEAAPGYNEAEVRFHILDPIVRKLGYPGDENVYLNLEEKLEYPYIHIGRRSKKDLPLGFPDYRAGLTGARGSFVAEAKGGSVPITSREVEQAHSYAAHAQVGANYFVLCNGIEIRIYETLSGPSVQPLVAVSISEIANRFHELENILSPGRLAKNCKVSYDSGLSLCKGLGSSARIRSGEYKVANFEYRIFVNDVDCTTLLKASSPQVEAIDQQLELIRTTFELRVSDGSAERDANGRIIANAKFSGVTKHNTAAMQLMGIDKLSFVTSDKFLSLDANNPTMFESTKGFTVEKGAAIPELFGRLMSFEYDVVGDVFIRAGMHLNNTNLRGEYLALSNYHVSLPSGDQLKIKLDFVGEFEMHLDS